MDNLGNYRALLAKVDELVAVITTKYDEHLACHAGCDSCCRHLSLSLVEGAALAVALHELPRNQMNHVRERAGNTAVDDPCPLLENGLCVLYAARPVICRTHGLPILIIDGEAKRVDFCPHNFRGVESLPGDAMIDLERLNTTLAAINALFITASGIEAVQGAERISIADALLLEV